MAPTTDTTRFHSEADAPLAGTLTDLIASLSECLEAVERHRRYERQAIREGYRDCARQFARMAAADRVYVAELLALVRLHIGEARTGSIFSYMAQD